MKIKEIIKRIQIFCILSEFNCILGELFCFTTPKKVSILNKVKKLA